MQSYVGVDISKTYFDGDIAAKRLRCTNDAKGHQQLIERLPPDAWVVLEATGTYGLALAEALVNAGFMVSMVNPLHVKRFAQSRGKRAKTDKVDAALLVEYARSLEQSSDKRDRLRLWLPPNVSVQHLKQLRAAYTLFSEMKTMTSNHLEALGHYPQVAPQALRLIQTLLENITVKIAAVEEAINDIINKEFEKPAAHLETIPGVSRKTAAAVIAAIGDIARFDNAKALAAYFALCPRIAESGSSVRKRGTLANDGVLQLRSQLFMCALSARKYNKSCKQLYERLIAKGKSKKTAILAVAHKLVRQIFAVLKYDIDFTEMPLNPKISLAF